MATVFTDTVLPETSGVNEDLNLGTVGDSVTLPTGVTLKTNKIFDAGGNNVITSNGSGSLTVNAGMAGDIALISTQTASSSSTIDFTTGIDSTYGVYIFKWVGIVPATDGAYGQVVFGTAGPSWGITKITTTWSCGNSENDSNSGPAYQTDTDNTDNTNPAYLTREIGNYSGENANVELWLFKPWATDYNKQIWARSSIYQYSNYAEGDFLGGWLRTNSAITAVRFQLTTGNMASGKIKMYGLKI